MELRTYRPEDLPEIARLFYDTINTVNLKDYSPEQVRVWSGCWEGLLERNDFFQRLYTLVAVEQGQIAAYGNIDGSGYLDHLYVHKDFQGQGLATALCDALEARCTAQGLKTVTTHASITARPFFEKRGYVTKKAQEVERQGVLLTNYEMIKALRPC